MFSVLQYDRRTHSCVVEGDDALREFIFEKARLDATIFFKPSTHFEFLQKMHRMNGCLRQSLQGELFFFPLYRLLNLMDVAGYQIVSHSTFEKRDMYVFRHKD